MTHVNIDGDIIVYSVGFAGEGDPVAFVIDSVNRLIDSIIKSCNADSYSVLLTGKGNYRETTATIAPYKGNRDGAHKPTLYADIRSHILNHRNGELIEGEEADDQLGIRATQHGHIIATLDKDLDTVAGTHYNWRKDVMYEVTETEAMHFFYTQLLTGDSTDNIPGMFKMVGRRALKKIKEGLLECTTPYDCYQYVYNQYAEGYDAVGMCLDEKDVVLTKWLTEIGQLLYIRKRDGEVWTPPEKEDGTDSK
jgi:DNA polymerase-1